MDRKEMAQIFLVAAIFFLIGWYVGESFQPRYTVIPAGDQGVTILDTRTGEAVCYRVNGNQVGTFGIKTKGQAQRMQ